MNFVIRIWMYLTPIVFPMKSEGWIYYIFKYNPLTYLIEISRNLIIGQDQQFIIEFTIISIISFIFVMFGWMIFRIALPHLVARSGS